MKKKSNMIFDSFDSVAKIAVDAINARYKISKRVEEFRNEVITLLYKLKRSFIRSIVEAVLIASGVLAFVLGLLIFASRYFPIDAILIAYGLIILILVLWQVKLRP
ncbi:MAG: hypothetical protein ACE5DM_05450 [Candidatus Nanoarchaeia archaeon]